MDSCEMFVLLIECVSTINENKLVSCEIAIDV